MARLRASEVAPRSSLRPIAHVDTFALRRPRGRVHACSREGHRAAQRARAHADRAHRRGCRGSHRVVRARASGDRNRAWRTSSRPLTRCGVLVQGNTSHPDTRRARFKTWGRNGDTRARFRVGSRWSRPSKRSENIDPIAWVASVFSGSPSPEPKVAGSNPVAEPTPPMLGAVHLRAASGSRCSSSAPIRCDHASSLSLALMLTPNR